MKFIIVNIITKKALYGIKDKTLIFSTYDAAYEVAIQFFENVNDFRVIEINY